ncbi:VOC family protein [Lentzea sp. NPDC006480]|uniref:VOC family protein n=1 Tax=Lentzea sp. NPDC006480 TaxID=3157176 RepID=UPI0033AF3C3F
MIDHLVYAAPELEAAVLAVEQRFGVRAAGGGQHLGLGTHNRLLALGPRTYLEIIAPDPGQPDPELPRPFGVDGVTEPRLVGWAITCDDIVRARDGAAARGFDPGQVIDGQRRTASGEVLRWRLTSNALVGGVVPFLISWGDTPSPALSAPGGLVLESLHAEHPDPALIAGQFAALGTDVEVRLGSVPALVAQISGQTLR